MRFLKVKIGFLSCFNSQWLKNSYRVRLKMSHFIIIEIIKNVKETFVLKSYYFSDQPRIKVRLKNLIKNGLLKSNGGFF